jgi:hypothetical protein
MNYQRQETQDISNKQRTWQFVIGCSLALLPLLIGLVGLFTHLYILSNFFLMIAYVLYIGEALTIFYLLWFPRIRFFGIGLLVGGIVTFCGFPMIWSHTFMLNFTF